MHMPFQQEKTTTMSPTNRTSVIHPDRPARQSAVGIPVCDECWERYRTERRDNQGIENRPFFRELHRVRYGTEQNT